MTNTELGRKVAEIERRRAILERDEIIDILEGNTKAYKQALEKVKLIAECALLAPSGNPIQEILDTVKGFCLPPPPSGEKGEKG